jgi:hypothetical protein
MNQVITRTRKREMSCATSGMKTDVCKRRRSVNDNTSAMCVGNLDINGKTANNMLSERVPKHMKLLHGFVWSDIINNEFFSPTAHFTLTDPPLPRPPPNKFENEEAIKTIQTHLDLFTAMSPIKIDAFEHLLLSHPNHTFVESVCVSLHEGFWPWAHTQKDSYGTILSDH